MSAVAISTTYPCALVTPMVVGQHLARHVAAIEYYNTGHPMREDAPGLGFHEEAAAICQVALYHMRRCAT
jgi:hypothetical protein